MGDTIFFGQIERVRKQMMKKNVYRWIDGGMEEEGLGVGANWWQKYRLMMAATSIYRIYVMNS